MTLTNKTVIISTLVTAGCILLLHFALSGTAKAGILDSVMTSDWKNKNLDNKYLLEVYGFDARVYEFTPTANPNITCVFVASNKSSGVACFPKAGK